MQNYVKPMFFFHIFAASTNIKNHPDKTLKRVAKLTKIIIWQQKKDTKSQVTTD